MKLLPPILILLVTVSAFDLISVKMIFCSKIKNHWAYDRLKLKHTCLEMVKVVGANLCVDVKKYFFHLKKYKRKKEILIVFNTYFLI